MDMSNEKLTRKTNKMYSKQYVMLSFLNLTGLPHEPVGFVESLLITEGILRRIFLDFTCVVGYHAHSALDLDQ